MCGCVTRSFDTKFRSVVLGSFGSKVRRRTDAEFEMNFVSDYARNRISVDRKL